MGPRSQMMTKVVGLRRMFRIQNARTVKNRIKSSTVNYNANNLNDDDIEFKTEELILTNRRPKTFKVWWRKLISENRYQNKARWTSITTGYGFISSLTIFLGVYSYILDTSVASRFMALFLSYGREHSQELIFFCCISCLLDLVGFVLGYVSVKLRRQTNLKYFAKCFYVQEIVHLIIFIICFQYYARAWSDSNVFLKNGDYLYDPLRVFTEDENNFNAINEFQKKLKCCGVKDYRDWNRIRWWSGKFSPVETLDDSFKTPTSCCNIYEVVNRTCIWFAKKTSDLTVNRRGCKRELIKYLKIELFTKSSLLIAIVVCRIIILIFLTFAVQSIPPMDHFYGKEENNFKN